jgi:O-antigen ligase
MSGSKTHLRTAILLVLFVGLLVLDTDWASFFWAVGAPESLKQFYDILTAISLLAAGLVLIRSPRRPGWWVWLLALATAGLSYLQRSWLLHWCGFDELDCFRTHGWQVKAILCFTAIPLLAMAAPAYSLHRFTTMLVVAVGLAHVGIYILARLGLVEIVIPGAAKLAMDASGTYAVVRAASWQNHLYVGAFMTLAWPLVLFPQRAVSPKHRAAIRFASACAVLFLACALLTYSRATIGGVGLQILFVAGLAKWGRPGDKRHARLALALSGLAIILAFVISPMLVRRVSSVAAGVERSTLNRLNFGQFALQMLALRPLSGWGPTLYGFLYHAFAGIPGNNYDPLDAHSSILYGLVCNGLAGTALFAMALCSPNFRATLALIPRAYLVAAVGLLPKLLADNITAPFFGFTLLFTLMAATVVARNWAHGRLLEKRPPRALAFLPPALFALYVLGILMPPPSLSKWFERVLDRAAQRVTDHVSFELRVEGSDFTIAYEPNRPHPSYLASLGVLASYTREAPDELVPVREFRLCEAAVTTRSLEFPATDLLSAAAVQPNSPPTLWLRENTNSRLLALHCQRWFGHEGFGQAELPTSDATRCCSCSGNTNPLQTYLEPTTATTHQLAQLWDNLLESTDTVAQAVRRGMEKNTDNLGFVRHLTKKPQLSPKFHCSFYTGDTREEVLYCNQQKTAGWRLVALYTNKSLPPITSLWADSAANRQFAELAFRVWSFFEVFDIESLPERQYRPMPLLWIIDSWKASRELD